MEISDILVIGFCIGYLIFMYIFSAGRTMRIDKRMHLLFCVPICAAAFHIAMTDLDVCLTGLYIGVFLAAGCFFLECLKSQRRLCIAAILCVLLTIIPCLSCSGYRNPGYTEEFNKGFHMMKEHYVLSEYKEIDWDSLYEKYVGIFRKADEAKDLDMAFDAWQCFTKEFHDAHVAAALIRNDDAARKNYSKNHVGYDYGFCLVTMEDGRTVFVNVAEQSEAYAMGIRDGMTMVSFDGQKVDVLKKNGNIWFSAFPDKENEAFYQSLTVTASGGETVSVTYLDEAGKEKTVELTQQGNNYDRFKKTIEQMSGYKEQTNLSYEMVSDDTACLIINDMLVDPLVKYGSEDEEDAEYEGVKAKLKDQIKKMKEEGATKLIIDLRSNPGGYLDMSAALASLFISEECFAAGEGRYNADTGGYEMIDSINIKPDNIWGDGEIVLLVNSETASAAELFTYFMGNLDNVTIMGMTKTVGSAMATGGYELNWFQLYFPIMLVLDEEANVLIDSDASGISNMPLDVQIPLDDEAFSAIFEEGKDYVLDYAVEYLNR